MMCAVMSSAASIGLTGEGCGPETPGSPASARCGVLWCRRTDGRPAIEITISQRAALRGRSEQNCELEIGNLNADRRERFAHRFNRQPHPVTLYRKALESTIRD